MARRSLIRWFLLFLSLFVLMTCNGGEQAEVAEFSDSGTAGELRLIIRWGGDDFASRQDLELRSSIEALIEERHVGRVLRSGTGMGWMGVWVKVENKTEAKKALEVIMKEIAPRSDYSISFPSPPASSSQP
jgi:hypothetical protein